MQLEIVTIGDELLLGQTIDTNAAHLARELAAVGISVARRATVGDGAEAIADAVGDALARTGAVITTGGLGPTADDLTKPAIAALFGRGMALDDEHLRWMEERWRTLFQRALPESNRAQAMLPSRRAQARQPARLGPGSGSRTSAGAGWACSRRAARDARNARRHAPPAARERAAEGSGVVRSRTLRTTSVAESALADRLGDLARGPEGLALAYLPGPGGHRPAAHGARAARRGDGRRARPGRRDAARARGGVRLRRRRGGPGRARARRGARRRAHIAVAESCTGGLLGARLTSVAGSSDVVLGGVIAYANAVKVAQLGVDAAEIEARGAVSEEVARAMADGVRPRFGATIGVGSRASPAPGWQRRQAGGHRLDRRVGGRRAPCGAQRLRRRPAEIRFRATQFALDMLRRVLRGEEPVRGFGAPGRARAAPR
jgi:nicotinamide-nucleotide amidase